MSQAKFKYIDDDLRELAELAMKCGDKVTYERIGYSQGKLIRYSVDYYGLDVPVIPDGNRKLGLPFPQKVFFRFIDGTLQKAPNQVVDKDEDFELMGKVASYHGCSYHGDNLLKKCELIEPLPGIFIPSIDGYGKRILEAIQYIKDNVSPQCYDNNFPGV
ncbi:MAG: hypothetical protein AABX13_02050 [Nanoarchaeota archaeon]